MTVNIGRPRNKNPKEKPKNGRVRFTVFIKPELILKIKLEAIYKDKYCHQIISDLIEEL